MFLLGKNKVIIFALGNQSLLPYLFVWRGKVNKKII